MKPSFYNYLAAMEDGKVILFNFLTNNCVELAENQIEPVQSILDHCDESTADHLIPLRQFLIEKLFLIPDEADELEVIRIRNLSRRYDSLVYNIVVMPTLECNFACKYCFESQKTGFMSKEIRNGIVNWAGKIARASRHCILSWYGGEPLLDFTIVEEINSRVKAICLEQKCGFVSDITTNGSLITDEVIRKAEELSLNQFQITIDGAPEFHNRYRPLRGGGESFDVVFTNLLRILRETRARVTLRINIDRENIDSIPGLLDRIPPEFRTPRLTVAFKDIFSDPGGEAGLAAAIDRQRITYKDLKRLYFYGVKGGFNVYLPAFKVQDHHCNSGNKNYFVVHPSGDLYRCTVEFETGRKVGRLLEDGNITVDSYANARWMSYIPGDDERCAQCKFLPMCHGGCRYNRLMGKKPCMLESADLNGVIELYYLSQLRPKSQSS